jgi:hypothetical protein
MANSYLNQFIYTLLKKPVLLAGSASFVDAVAASVVIQDLTYTANAVDASGNSISIVYVGGGTAGSEVVTVTGNAIEVEIEDGVSTATEIKTAIEAEAAADALVSVTVSGTSSNAQDIHLETFLAGGLDFAYQLNNFKGVESIEYLDEGEFIIHLADAYQKLLFAKASVESSTNTDLVAQLISSDVGNKEIEVNLNQGATPKNPSNGAVVHFEILLSDSSVD